MSIIDGRFLVEPAEAPLAAGRQAPVLLMVGANDRDLPLGEAADKAALFASFGTETDTARRLYDPLGNQSWDRSAASTPVCCTAWRSVRAERAAGAGR